MINKVFLLWQSYITKEILLIASLTKVNNKYIFKYEKDALKAMNLGCFLPFAYTESELRFDVLPPFFSQRMLTSKFNRDKFDVKVSLDNELALLTYGDSIRNSDNFRIVTEKGLLDFENNQDVKQVIHK